MAKRPDLLVEEGDVHDVAVVPGDPGGVDRIAGHCEDSERVRPRTTNSPRRQGTTSSGRPESVLMRSPNCGER